MLGGSARRRHSEQSSDRKARISIMFILCYGLHDGVGGKSGNARETELYCVESYIKASMGASWRSNLADPGNLTSCIIAPYISYE